MLLVKRKLAVLLVVKRGAIFTYARTNGPTRLKKTCCKPIGCPCQNNDDSGTITMQVHSTNTHKISRQSLRMNRWIQAISLMLLAGLCNSEINTTDSNRTLVSFAYQYSIRLNITAAIPSIDDAIDQLDNHTFIGIDQLVQDGDGPLFFVVDLDSQVQGVCQSVSDLCALVESTATLSLRAGVEDRLVEYAGLEEVESLFDVFNSHHDDVSVSFAGPFVVQADLSILLEGANGRMSQVEIDVFEESFVNIIGLYLLNNEPFILLRSAAIFLQQTFEQPRRLQAGGDGNGIVVRVHVTGQCNQCLDNDFSRLTGEAVTVRRPELQRDLENKGQESGTDYFQDVTVHIAMIDQAPGISECCLDFYGKPNAFPYWVLLVTAACVIVISTATCCAACHSEDQSREKGEKAFVQTRTEDTNEDGTLPMGDESKKKVVEVMPHLRNKTQKRLAVRESGGRNEARASSLTF